MKRFLLALTIFSIGNSTDMLLLVLAYEQFKGAGMSERASVASLPLLWALLHVVKSVATPLGGRFSDRFGRGLALRCGWLVYAGVYVGFALWAGAVAPWVLFTIYGLYYGLVEGPERALVADLTHDPSRRGMAYGLFHLVTGITALPASVLCGTLWYFYGYMPAFLAGAAMALVGMIMLTWALKDQTKSSTPDQGYRI